jgi:hypothetical protein
VILVAVALAFSAQARSQSDLDQKIDSNMVDWVNTYNRPAGRRNHSRRGGDAARGFVHEVSEAGLRARAT